MTFTPSKENTPLTRGVDDTKNTNGSDDSLKIGVNGKFAGTENPRELRVIAGLMRRPMPREHVDSEAGASNGPELIANLRRKGLEVPCDRVPVLDRDGFEVRRGIYNLPRADRRKVNQWLARRRQA